MLASLQKNTPIYLKCHLLAKPDKDIAAHLENRKFYQDPELDEDDLYEKGEEHDDNDPDKVLRQYQQQYDKHKKEPINEAEGPRTKRGTKNSSESNDDDSDEVHDDQEIKRLYNKQFQLTIQQYKKLNTPAPSKRRARRSIEGTYIYEWLKDGEVIVNSTNGLQNVNGYHLMSNGTLKFIPTNGTNGEYRCRAKYETDKFTLGPIISTATVVEIASKF